jgi:DUF1680 family protein
MRAFILLLLIADMATGATMPGGKRIVEPFDYQNVTLDDGSLRRQFDDTREYYLRIPNDDLLKGFRSRAGRPAPGEDLGGWYTGDIFHIFGQVVSGLARMYRATGDPACRDKVNVLVSEWGKCIADDGYFFYSKQPNAPHYIYDKTVCGLVDAYLYCGNKEALRHLSRITDWAIKNLDRTNAYAFNSGMGPTEWYTLSENLYRAYLATGDEKYRDFAKVWESKPYWDHFAKKTDIFSEVKHYHAYSHCNTLSGAAAAYAVTGEQRYLDAVRNAFDYFQQNQCFATGGFGPDEQLLPPDQLPAKLADSTNHFEVQCGSWAAFKLCKYLISFTGDARYGDWIERLAINGIGAGLQTAADGRPFYYAGYSLSGAVKEPSNAPWSCCAGTRVQAIADYYDLVYFKDADDLYINLFTPSTVHWRDAAIRQVTRFPEGDAVDISISAARPSEFGIKVRLPGWLAKPMTAEINGKPVEAKVNPLHWAEFRREWKDGDRLTLKLPMDFMASRFPASSKNLFPAAISYGPVVLAFRSGSNPAKQVDFSHLSKSFVKSPGEPLTYHLASDPGVLVRPYYDYEEGEPYYLYLDPTSPWVRTPHAKMVFTGEWGSAADFRMTKVPGSTVEASFEGTDIRWVGHRFDDAGKAEICIDDKVVGIIDQYGPVRGTPFTWEHGGLAPGRHTIKMTLLPDKNPESRDYFINIVAFDSQVKQ